MCVYRNVIEQEEFCEIFVDLGLNSVHEVRLSLAVSLIPFSFSLSRKSRCHNIVLSTGCNPYSVLVELRGVVRPSDFKHHTTVFLCVNLLYG